MLTLLELYKHTKETYKQALKVYQDTQTYTFNTKELQVLDVSVHEIAEVLRCYC